MHPFLEVVDGEPMGWAVTDRSPVKTRHLAANPTCRAHTEAHRMTPDLGRISAHVGWLGSWRAGHGLLRLRDLLVDRCGDQAWADWMHRTGELDGKRVKARTTRRVRVELVGEHGRRTAALRRSAEALEAPDDVLADLDSLPRKRHLQRRRRDLGRGPAGRAPQTGAAG
jgi:hypothetical protein